MVKNKRRQPGRLLAAVALGGCLLQVGGCVTGLAPVYLSILESTLLSTLVETLLTP